MSDENSKSNESLNNIFLYETQQLLENLESLMLKCESSNAFSDADINEIFRIMHTIKGSSSLMHFDNIEALTHTLEDLFDYLREEKHAVYDASSLSDLVFEAIDSIKIDMEKIKNNEEADGDFLQLIKKITVFLGSLKNNKGADYKATIYFEDDCGMESLRAFSVLHEMQDYVTVVSTQPESLEEDDECIHYIQSKGLTVLFNSDLTYEEIFAQLNQIIFLKRLELTALREINTNLNNHTSSSESPNSIQSTTDAPAEISRSVTMSQNLISVDVSKLDSLMDLVGELVISEAMVTHHPSLSGLELGSFYKAAAQLHKITSDLQDMIMSIRMMPLSVVFNRMNRIVRDMCRELDKEATLILIGEETEVDKNIIEHISDPIMHIIRNAIDHGLEYPEERTAKGKPKAGTVSLEARNSGGDVLITIKDDGKGLDKDAILSKAVENGLVTQQEHELSLKEIYSLVLLPGFSTNSIVTEFSGRGVGMDVVVNNIEAIGGAVSIDSYPGEGTSITLKIPLTLAIIDGMNVKVGHSRYTIPITSIRESFRPTKDDIIHTPDGNEMVMIRGECYSVMRLHERLGVKTDITEFSQGVFIMLENDDKRICIFADALLGEQQVVVKPLPGYITNIKDVHALSGCTLLGDGSISLILNISGLFSMVNI